MIAGLLCKTSPLSPGSCPTMKSECSSVFLITTKSRHVRNTHIPYICFLSVLSNQSSALLYYIKIFHPETVSLLSAPCSSREGHLSTCFLVHSRSWVPLWCLASKCPLRRDHRSSPFLQREISCSPRRLPPSRSCQHRQVRTKGSVAQLATTSTSSQRKNVLVLLWLASHQEVSLPEGTPGNRKVSRVDDLLIDELVGVVVLCICGERRLVPTLIFKMDFN